MQKEKRYIRRSSTAITLMIVPLIDVIFLLLLFFVITTSFEVTARIRIQLPSPNPSLAQHEDLLKDIVIHCEYNEGATGQAGRALYRFGTDPPEQLDAISARLRAAFSKQTDAKVIVRADRRLVFGEVRRVMEVIADNKIPLMQVSVLRGSEG